jgi:hypothetical protein
VGKAANSRSVTALASSKNHIPGAASGIHMSPLNFCSAAKPYRRGHYINEGIEFRDGKKSFVIEIS